MSERPLANDLTDLARKALKVSTVESLVVTPYVDRVDVKTYSYGKMNGPSYIPGMSQVTISIELVVTDDDAGRRLFPETFDRLDRMIEEMK